MGAHKQGKGALAPIGQCKGICFNYNILVHTRRTKIVATKHVL